MVDKRAKMAKVAKMLDEPNMSDTTLLLSVEDLINMAIGPVDGNIVDFTIIQTILHILARQMRLLEQKVVLEVGALPPPTKLKPPKGKEATSTSESTSSGKGKGKGKKGGIQEEDGRDSDEEDNKSKGKGRDAERAGRDAGRGAADDERDGKVSAKGGKGDKDTDKGGKDTDKSGKDTDKGGKGGKDDKGGKGGKDTDKPGKGGKDTDKAGKGGEKGAEAEKGKDKAGKGRDQDTKGQAKADKDAKDKDPKKRDKEAAEREREKEDRKGGIGVKEVTSQTNEKLLVVGKGRATRGSSEDRGRRSIEVVTQSQFALLQAAVDGLRAMTAPPPPPELPGNDKLRADLAAGNASLTDAMQTMQVAARVQAAEQAIARLGGLLTALAGGALPGADGEDDDEDDELAPRSRPSTTSRKSVVLQLTKGASAASNKRHSVATTASAGRASVASRASMGSPLVTQTELSDAVANMRMDIMKNLQAMSTKAQTAADNAANVAKSVVEKIDIAMRLNSRITTLHSLVNDYAEQLAGFDAGLTTQMMSFQEQMAMMRKDLGAGLAQLENANNNAETAAVMELTERYQLLAADLEHTLLAHQALTTFQQQLSLDFRSLYECVEMLREQKADRDEVLDGLRDKADNARLAGLLREEEFEQARAELDLRMELCHEKFRKQDLVWVTAIKDLTQVVQTKAELMDLLKTREETTDQLQEIHEMIKKLALVLGEPKAAMLTRQLAHGASCGACLVPALMDPEDATSGKPPALPAARGAPVGAEEPCEQDWQPPQPPELRPHTCRRWVGGSHTLLPPRAREPPRAPPLPRVSTMKYTGVGADGRLYLMEVELQPCVECNPLPPSPAEGAPGPRAGERAAQPCACGDAGEEKRRTTLLQPAVIE